jgi:hypothetical protein
VPAPSDDGEDFGEGAAVGDVGVDAQDDVDERVVHLGLPQHRWIDGGRGPWCGLRLAGELE